MLIPPTAKAYRIAGFLRLILLIQILFIAACFATFRWFDAAFDCLGVFIGWCGVRNEEGYMQSQVICYCFYSAITFIWSIVKMGMFFSNSDNQDIPPQSWQFWPYTITMIIGPFIYTAATVTGWFLYRELHSVIVEMQQSLSENASSGSGGGYGSYQPPSINSSSSAAAGSASANSSSGGGAYQSAAARNNATAGFRPFQGTGHRLA